MRATLTISLPKDLRRNLEKWPTPKGSPAANMPAVRSRPTSFAAPLRAARRELVPQARARGLYTDEDVFKIIS